MQKFVKYRLVSWHQPVLDAFGNEVIAERHAVHGQIITTDALPEAEEDRIPNAIYDVPKSEMERLANLPDGGAFFSDEEEAAFRAGVTDFTGEQYGEERISGDTGSTLPEASLGPDGVGGHLAGGHPLGFEQMNAEQLAQWMREEEPDTSRLVELAYTNPLMMPNIMDAASLAERDDVEALSQGLAAVAGAGGSADLPPDPGDENVDETQGHGTAGSGGEDNTGDPEQIEAPNANASTAEWADFFEKQGLSNVDESGAPKKRDAMVVEWEQRQK